MPSPTIPIRVDPQAEQACPACVHAATASACRSAFGQTCVAPALIGPRAEIDRLMQALGEALGFRANAEDPMPVSALRIEPGEVELTLQVTATCGGRSLATRAFETLRRLLPDTDIYVGIAAG